MAQQKYYSPYVGNTFGYTDDPALFTHIAVGELTDLVDDGRRVVRLAGGTLAKLDDSWFATEVEAKRRMAVMLCDRLDQIRRQIDGLISEIKAAEIAKIAAEVDATVAA